MTSVLEDVSMSCRAGSLDLPFSHYQLFDIFNHFPVAPSLFPAAKATAREVISGKVTSKRKEEIMEQKSFDKNRKRVKSMHGEEVLRD